MFYIRILWVLLHSTAACERQPKKQTKMKKKKKIVTLLECDIIKQSDNLLSKILIIIHIFGSSNRGTKSYLESWQLCMLLLALKLPTDKDALIN